MKQKLHKALHRCWIIYTILSYVCYKCDINIMLFWIAGKKSVNHSNSLAFGTERQAY